MEADKKSGTELGDGGRGVPSNNIQIAVRLWLIANMFLLISLYVRVRSLFPNTAASNCSVFLLLWNIIPLLVMLCLTELRAKKSLPNGVVQLAAVGVSAYGANEFLNAFYLYPADSWAGFTMYFMPFFQLLVFLPAFLFSSFLWGAERGGTGTKQSSGDERPK